MTVTIQALKKVSLLLNTSGPGSNPVPFVFIHGIAGKGLCPFEQILQDKEEGEELSLAVTEAEAHGFFDHLFFPLHQALGLPPVPQPLALKVVITAVKDADNREVVQSMAQSISGCGGSCGCGCS